MVGTALKRRKDFTLAGTYSLDWTQAICERCWMLRDSSWTADDRLKIPYRDANSELHFCAYCGLVTFVGIFIREDPTQVRFPKEKEDA